MLKHFIMWAFLCTTALIVYPQNPSTPDSIPCDSIEFSISPHLLEEIVVKASPIINKTDGQIIHPDRVLLMTSADGIDLLRKLQLSRITVNPLTNSIEVSGGGTVVLCINGIESSSAQIAAIKPEDIVRIEYHDKPTMRFEGASTVIDYITSRHDSGGNLMLDSFGAFACGRWASMDNIAGQYNRGQSVWTANVSYFGQRKDKWIRDYDETWYYPDATISRHEEGLPITAAGSGLESVINYNYLCRTGNILNLRIGFDFDDVPSKEEGDRKALLHTSGSEKTILVTEHTQEHSVQPGIGIYYKHKLSDHNSITFDAQASYMHSGMRHTYSEDNITEDSEVKGNKYVVKMQGMYENRAGSRLWSIGVSGNNSILRNLYLTDESVDLRIVQSETALIGEYSNRFGYWGITGRLKGTYRYLGQQSKQIHKTVLLPEINLSYKPSDAWFLRYAAEMDYKMPSAAEISDVIQPIQSGMIRRGNPELSPYRVITQSFDSSFGSRFIGVGTRIEYRNEHRPIMESTLYADHRFVRTYFNQRSFQRLMIDSSLSVRPWENHLSVMATPTLTRYFSHGRDYHHCHSIFRVGLSVDFSYGNWLAYGNIMSGPANAMYGEEIIEEKNMNQIMAGYRQDRWSVHIGVFNAFMKNYWMKTSNLSALTPYTSIAHSGRSSSYVALKVTLSLDFGRKSRQVDLRENIADKDTGILSGTK